MVSWLATQILPFSLVLCVLILGRNWVNKRLGAQVQYGLWLLAPISLALSFLSMSGSQFLPDASLQKYVVNLQQSVTSFAVYEPLFWLWASGASLIGLCVLRAYWRQRPTDIRYYSGTSKHTGGAEQIELYQSSQISSPMVYGFWSPKLVLPTNFSRAFTLTEQRLILAHEMTHLRRFDLHINALAVCVLVLFWFNPLTWIAYNRFRHDQELACDARVLTGKSDALKLAYAKALIKCVDHLRHQHMAPIAHLSYADKLAMQQRLIQIRHIQVTPKVLTLLTVLLGIVMMLSISLVGNVTASNTTVAQVPLSRTEPVYPIQAAEAGVTGHVVLGFDISPVGKVENLHVISSEPANTFERSALNAVAKWQYGVSTAARKDIRIQLDYQLQ